MICHLIFWGRYTLFGFSFGMFYIVCVLRDGGLVLFSITFFKMDNKNNNSAAAPSKEPQHHELADLHDN